MNEQFIIEKFEEIVGRFGIDIRFEPVHQDKKSIKLIGGLSCLIGGGMPNIRRPMPRDQVGVNRY